MVPMKVGDYVEYSGVKVGNGDIVCYAIVVNIGVQTSGNQPGFVRVEDTLIGVADNAVDVEAARFRVSSITGVLLVDLLIYVVCWARVSERFANYNLGNRSRSVYWRRVRPAIDHCYCRS